jgi:DNA-binding FadR family transcriptional regulator
MIEMRKIIELASVKLAIERATDDDVEAIREVQRQGGASLGNMDRFIEFEFSFHSSIAETSRNSLLFKSVKTMRTLMSEFNHELLVHRPYRVSVNSQHARICDALERRDTEAAVAAMDCHLMNIATQAKSGPASAKSASAAKSPGKKRR